MPATPERIAICLNDGVVLSKDDPTIKNQHPNAEDDGTTEIEMFFDDPADAQVLLDERWDFRSSVGRPHEQVELDSGLDLGTVVPITPAAPQFEISDSTRGINQAQCIIRAYSLDYTTERYAIEVVGTKDTGVSSMLLLEDDGALLLEDGTPLLFG